MLTIPIMSVTTNSNKRYDSCIDHFPQEIWDEIAKYLDSHDLLTLRLTNRLINERVIHNAEWQYRSLKYWVQYERANLDAFGTDSVISGNWDSYTFADMTNSIDKFGFFKLRSRSDWHILGQLMRLSEISDSKEYWDLYSSILRNKEGLLLPILHRVTSKWSRRVNVQNGRGDLLFDVDRLDLSFDVLNIAKSVLTTLRHRHMFELLLNQFDLGGPTTGGNDGPLDDISTFNNTSVLPDCSRYLETCCLQIATMDTAFDRLLMCRSRFYDRITRFIEQNESYGDIRRFLTLPSTMKIDKIVTVLYRILNISIERGTSTANRPSYNQSPRTKQYYYEDFMITRIYAQEIKGHPLLLLAIIQRIGQHFGVETVMSRYYLIIKDNRLRDGETYLTISPKNYKPNIFLKKDLINLIQHNSRGTSIELIKRQVLPNFLKPLTNQMFLRIIFDDLLPKFSTSIWSSNESSTREKDSNPLERIETLFPISHHPVQNEAIKYFSCLYSIIRTIQHSEELTSRRRTSETIQTAAVKELVKLINVMYPGDLRYLKEEKDYRQAKGTPYLEWLLAKHSIVVPEPNLKPQLESHKDDIDYFSLVGTFVIARHEQLVCVVGVKAMRSIGDDIKYYTVMNCTGEFFVELSTRISEFEWDTEKVAVFLQLCSAHHELGLVFEGIDWESRKLLVNKRVRSLIERQDEH